VKTCCHSNCRLGLCGRPEALDAGLDTGDTLMHAEELIRSDDTAITLGARLAKTGAELMITTLTGLIKGTVHP